MRTIATCSAFLIASLAFGCRSLSDPADSNIKDASSASGVSILSGTSNTLEPSDLRAIAANLANAKFIALGEGSHGTIEFSSVRSRLAKILVEEFGVRTIGFEMPWDSAAPVEKYIQTCAGSPPSFWWGQTEDLQRYLCDFNQRHPTDRVHVFGFDTNIYDGALASLGSFVQSINDLQLNVVIPTLQSCRYTFPGGQPQTPSASQLPGCISSLSAAINLMTNREQAFKSVVGPQRFGEAKILFETLKWMNQDIQNKDSQQVAFNVRDAGMANLAPKWAQLFSPNGKVILWAENAHLRKKNSAVLMRVKLPQDHIDQIRQALAQNPSTPIDPEIDLNTMTYSKYEPVSMGEYLYNTMGSAYVAVGTLGYDVSAASVKPLPNGTLDRTPIRTVGASGSIQELIHSNFGASTVYASFPNSVFNAAMAQVETAAGFKDFSYVYSPKEQYDGIIFIDLVHATP